MIFYGEQNCYEAAKDRIRFIFDEFYGQRTVGVTMSGGKDSTVVLYLTHEVMQERGIEKVPVMFLDQEAEVPLTIDYIRYVMNLPWVEPYWVQTHFKEWNSSKGDWFNVWGPGEEWCREKEPNNPYADITLKRNKYFKNTLDCAQKTLWGNDFISLGGVRIEESPTRMTALTTGDVYKGISWGKGGGYTKKGDAKGMVLYPIWDWKLYDVWYYIFSNRIKYNTFYNYMFTKRPLRECRVSSIIHENSIQDLKDVKEIDPAFYNKLVKRVPNVNTTVQSYEYLITYLQGLPPYFADWREYIYYLADNLCEKEDSARKIKRMFDRTVEYWSKKFGKYEPGVEYVKKETGWSCLSCILAEDFTGSKLMNNTLFSKFYNDNYVEIQKANKNDIEGTDTEGV